MKNIRLDYQKKRLLNILLETCELFRREDDLEALENMELLFEDVSILVADYEYQGSEIEKIMGLLMILQDKMKNDDFIGLVDCLERLFIPTVKEIY